LALISEFCLCCLAPLLFLCNRCKKFSQQSNGTDKRYKIITWWPILWFYFCSLAAHSALTAIKTIAIIPARCIAMPKLLGDLLPKLGELFQSWQIEW